MKLFSDFKKIFIEGPPYIKDSILGTVIQTKYILSERKKYYVKLQSNIIIIFLFPFDPT